MSIEGMRGLEMLLWVRGARDVEIVPFTHLC